MLDLEVTFMCQAVEDFDELASRFHDCFEGILSLRDGQLRATVEFQADRVPSGLSEVVTNLGRIGIRPVRVDRDLVDATEISNRLDVARQTVQQWATGRQRVEFPIPIAYIGTKRIWEWAQVANWAANHLPGFDQPRGLTHLEATELDMSLANETAHV